MDALLLCGNFFSQREPQRWSSDQPYATLICWACRHDHAQDFAFAPAARGAGVVLPAKKSFGSAKRRPRGAK